MLIQHATGRAHPFQLITYRTGMNMTKTRSSSVDLDKLPLQPQRWKYVLALILERHNWRHAVKDKGVSHETMEDRRQFCFRVFMFLRDNPIKCFKLDPRSFSGRHVDLLLADWRRRAEAGQLGPAALQKVSIHPLPAAEGLRRRTTRVGL